MATTGKDMIISPSKRARKDASAPVRFAIFLDFDCTISHRHLFKTMRKWPGAMKHFSAAFPSYCDDEAEEDSDGSSAGSADDGFEAFGWIDPARKGATPKQPASAPKSCATNETSGTRTDNGDGGISLNEGMVSSESKTGGADSSEQTGKMTRKQSCPTIKIDDPLFILYIFGAAARIAMLEKQFTDLRALGSQLFISTHGFGLEVVAALKQVDLLKHFVGIQAADGLWDRASGFRATEYSRPKMVWIEDTIRAITVAPTHTWFADDSIRNYDTNHGAGMLPSSGKPIHVLSLGGTFQQDGGGLSKCHFEGIRKTLELIRDGHAVPARGLVTAKTSDSDW